MEEAIEAMEVNEEEEGAAKDEKVGVETLVAALEKGVEEEESSEAEEKREEVEAKLDVEEEDEE